MSNPSGPESLASIDSLFENTADPATAFAHLEALFAPLNDRERLDWREALMVALERRFSSHEQDFAVWLMLVLAHGPAFGRAADGSRLLDGRQETGSAALEERFCQLLAPVLALNAPAERGHWIDAAIDQLSDLSLITALFRMLACAAGEETLSDARDDYFGPQTNRLRAKLLARVRNLAKTGDIWAQASPSALLWFWWACAQEQEVYEFTQKTIRDKESAVRLFPVPVDRLFVDDVGHEVVLARRWSKILDLHGLERPALELALQGETREVRKSARRYLDAFANGKSDLYR